MPSFVTFSNVGKIYHTGELDITALHDVNFEIEKGEFCVIVGASGAGKTTILNILGGMDTLTNGQVFLDGQEISNYDKKQLTSYRRFDIGFVFQFYNLVQNLTALENVDAAKCKRAGISPSVVLDALGSYCGGAYISNYNQFGKVYRVMMQASPEYRLDEQALGNMFVRNGTEMAPVSQFVTLNRVLGPETANRFNLYSAISANVNPAEGYSSGEVQKVIAEVAEQTLPLGYGYEYGGMAREEANTGGAQTVFIYAICIFLIYLILACLYESFLIPFAVIFSVPFGLMGSFLFAKVLGLENNIYLQTGVIMLIGLLAKTAILITEYAIERRRKGMGIVESAYSAAQVRLRPILMTVLTMIFGMLPLMFSSGAGANGNSSLGTGVVGGMLIGTLALLFVVPVFYIIFEYLQEKVRPPMEEEADMQVLLEKQKSEAERAKD